MKRPPDHVSKLKAVMLCDQWERVRLFGSSISFLVFQSWCSSPSYLPPPSIQKANGWQIEMLMKKGPEYKSFPTLKYLQTFHKSNLKMRSPARSNMQRYLWPSHSNSYFFSTSQVRDGVLRRHQPDMDSPLRWVAPRPARPYPVTSPAADACDYTQRTWHGCRLHRKVACTAVRGTCWAVVVLMSKTPLHLICLARGEGKAN